WSSGLRSSTFHSASICCRTSWPATVRKSDATFGGGSKRSATNFFSSKPGLSRSSLYSARICAGGRLGKASTNALLSGKTAASCTCLNSSPYTSAGVGTASSADATAASTNNTPIQTTLEILANMACRLPPIRHGSHERSAEQRAHHINVANAAGADIRAWIALGEADLVGEIVAGDLEG